MYDLASALTAHIGSDAYGVLRDVWLAGYTEIMPVEMEVHDIVDALGIARLLKILGWLTTRPDSEIARAHGPAVKKMVVRAAHAYRAGNGRFP